MRRFEDKVVLVTGAAAGIGKATAERIAAEGGRLVCSDVQAAAVEATAKGIQSAGGEALAVVSDVSDPTSTSETNAGPHRTSEAPSAIQEARGASSEGSARPPPSRRPRRRRCPGSPI